MNTAQLKATEFLKNASYFHLGCLPTEASHHLTRDLTDLANNNLPLAIDTLKKVDLLALKKLNSCLPELNCLTVAINETLAEGGRIFLCGCGATGRLSLSLEYLWRQQQPEKSESVVSFMAGGDVALANSLEGFEDYPEYGAEHLVSLKFSENDLLISTTEGGETPYVIGATEKATEISKRKVFFLYCNPREILIEHIERSRQVLENPEITSICLDVGPMALSGSTRMQASTVLMLGVGLSLLEYKASTLTDFINFYEKTDVSKISDFIKLESDIYKQENRVLYSAEEMAITVFTDTTERSPTFSLPQLGNTTQNLPDLSYTHLMIPSANTVKESWQKLLKRTPRVLHWPERNKMTTLEYLEGFNFSKQALTLRKKSIPTAQHFVFSIENLNHSLKWQLQDLETLFKVSNLGNLFDHIFLKLLLNTHSTLIMGRLGRTASNCMTYVRPTNGKLIDRAARYTLWLLKQKNIEYISYEQVIFEIFKQLENLKAGESVVLKSVTALTPT